MGPRFRLSCPPKESASHHFHVFAKTWPGHNGSRPRTETAYIPRERKSRMIMSDVEYVSFYELEPEISWIKGGPGPPAGGRVSGQSGVPCLPGGECFAPYRHVEFASFYELEPEISGSKGVRETRQEEGSLGSLTAPCHREESASHHFVFENPPTLSRCVLSLLFDLKTSLPSSTDPTSYRNHFRL